MYVGSQGDTSSQASTEGPSGSCCCQAKDMSECARADVQQACDSCAAAAGAADTEQRPEAAWPPQASLVKHPLPDTDDAVDWDAVRKADIEEVRAAGSCHQHTNCLCHGRMIEAVKATSAANCSCRTRVGTFVYQNGPLDCWPLSTAQGAFVAPESPLLITFDQICSLLDWLTALPLTGAHTACMLSCCRPSTVLV